MKDLKFKKYLKQTLIVSFIISVINISWAQTIPIKMERNITLVPVRVGDSDTLKILLDTGMAFNGLLIYNPDLDKSIHLEKEIEVLVPGAGSDEPSTAIMDDSGSFFIGDVEFQNQKIIVLQSDIYKGFPSDGIVGYSIFGNYITELDYDKNLMILHNEEKFLVDSSWEVIPIYFEDNQIPWMDIYIAIGNEEPIPISVYIDFASGDAIELLEKPEMNFSLPKETESSYLGRGLSGDIYGKKGNISKLIIGDYEFNKVTAVFAPANVRSKQQDADGILGCNALRRFNLIFDYANKKLYLKPNKYYNDLFN